MAQPTDDALNTSWRALSGQDEKDGWRLISIEKFGSIQIYAARRFPGNEEAVIASFPGLKLPPSRQLPEGRGFEVVKADAVLPDSGATAVALVRQVTGSLDLFELMAADVIDVVRRSASSNVRSAFEAFMRRVMAWQDFMQRPREHLLSAEAELGLFGELLFLRQLISSGMLPIRAVESWEGPMDGLQDFVLEAGAVEVKTTASSSGFPAKILSLEQLDDSERQPLFLGAWRMTLDPSGQTLPELVSELRGELQQTGAAQLFETRLMHAGYRDAQADAYTRCFAAPDLKLLRVDGEFPRLTRANVPTAIRRAGYEIDLDLVSSAPVEPAAAFTELGII